MIALLFVALGVGVLAWLVYMMFSETADQASPVCPACGEPLLPDDRTCPMCGAELRK